MVSIRYILTSKSQGTKKLYTQPIGWNDDSRKLSRSTDNYGIMYDFVEGIEFVKDGYDFIVNTERSEGFDAIVIVRREVRNLADEWELDYQGELDLTTKEKTRNGYKVNILQGGLSELLKNINSEEYELERTTSVDGDDIGILSYEKGQINGRNLFISSLLESSNNGTIQGTRVVLSGGASTDVESYYVPRLSKTFSGDEDIIGVVSTPLKPFETANQFRPDLDSSHSFTDRYGRVATKVITTKVDVDIEPVWGNGDIQLILYKHQIDSNGSLDYVSATTLKSVTNVNSVITINETFITSIDIEPEQYLSLVFYIRGSTQSGSTLIWEMEQRNIELTINEDSAFAPTTFSGLTIEQCYKRLSKIATGKDLFKSNYFNTKDFKDALITNGKRIRNFNDSIELSLKKLNDSCKAMFNTSMGVERINNIERFVVEPYEYFFNPKLILSLGQVNKVTESFNDKFLFSGIKSGYKKGGDYEERQGLDEYNTQSTFSHNFKRIDTPLDAQSDLRADTIGIELTRRQQIVDFPTEDTTYDKDNFIIDCYKTGQLYINRPFDMDFAIQPLGIFSPETAYNLRLTPKNNLYRISKSFAWLSAYSSSKTNFVSGTRNTDLTTRLIGGVDRVENEDIENSTLDKPLLQPTQVKFTYKLSPDEFKTLLGNTDGVPNWYRLISYIDDLGVLSYGYLLEYEPKDEGKMTLIKANI